MADATMRSEAALDLEALYRREHDRVLAMCVAILRDRGDAEDAVQETFARLAARLDTLEGDPVAYLVVVARNVCRTELRRRTNLSTRGAERSADPTPEDTAVRRGLLGFVWRRLARVEQVLLVDVFSGLSLAEIAEQTGSNTDAVAQRVSRLRRRIRRMVAAPAALLLPLLHGNAMGRTVLQRLHLGPLLGPVINRFQATEQAMGPLLVGIAAGVVVLPTGPATPPAIGARPSTAVVMATPAAAAAGLLGTINTQLGAASRAPAAVPATSPAATVAKVRALLPPPPDAEFVTFTPSPHFTTDRVVFAASGGCAHPPSCPTVWRSGDAGATWKPLWTAGPTDSTFRVALPPSFPADPTIFGIDAGAVYRSDDGGATFRRVVAAGTSSAYAAVDPSSQPGDTRVLLVGNTSGVPPSVYSAQDDKVHQLSGLPTDTTDVRLFAAPGASAAYLDVSEAVGSGGMYACPATATACTRIGPYQSLDPLALSPTFDTDHTWFTLSYQAMRLGTLDSATTTAVPLSDARVLAFLPAADYAHTHVIDLVVGASSGPFHGVRVVNGTPQAWTLSLPASVDASTMMRLPDGHLLVGLLHAGGTLCSADEGMSWGSAC